MSEIRTKIRLFVEQNIVEGGILTLKDDQSHYLNNVMRQKQNSVISIFNEKDGEFLAEIISISKRNTEVKPIRRTRTPLAKDDVTNLDLLLCFAPVKNVTASYIVQKATELGVTSICPVVTEYTVVRKVNNEKLLATAIEASEQTERIDVPQILEATSFDNLLRNWDLSRKLIYCNERGGSVNILDALKSDAGFKKLAVIIGPEGGFSEAENRSLMQQQFCIDVSLGPRILRAETATIAALSCIMAKIGDWNLNSIGNK